MTAAAALLPGTALAQMQPQPFPQPFPLPFPPLLPPLPLQPLQPLPQQQEPEPEAEEAQSEDEWYIGSVPDGQFQIRKVNFEKLDPAFRRQLVSFAHHEQPGTLVIDAKNHFLSLLREGNTAIRYGVGVGREGFSWSGTANVGRKAEWPDWIPPKEMLLRQPELPERMPGGPNNPLGARALYLFVGNKDTLYRIHGTREPWTIGKNVSSGCVRLLNEEVADLYLRTPVGTRVVVL